EQRAAGAGEEVDDRAVVTQRRGPCEGGGVRSDRVGQSVPRTLDRGSPQEPDTSRIPVGRAQTVDRDVVRIAIAVAPVTLYLPEPRRRVPLPSGQQQPPVIGR